MLSLSCIMRTVLLALLFGLVFLLPRHVPANDVKLAADQSFTGAFGNIQLERILISDNSQNSNNYFENDLSDIDDDDDVTNSIRKKIFFVKINLKSILFSANNFFDSSIKNIWSAAYFLHSAQLGFISLRVFRL